VYKQLCDPADSDRTNDPAPFDPIAACLLQPYLLPLQLQTLRRIVPAYQPGAWLSLAHLRSQLACASVPDAALLAKNLAGLAVRRPAEWESKSLAEQDSDDAVMAENTRASAADGVLHWAVQVGRAATVPQVRDADAIVHKAFYLRELRRRVRRVQAQHASFDEQAAQPALFGLTDAQTAAASHADSSAVSVSRWEAHAAATPLTPLWCFGPQTTFAADTLLQWIWSA
jgi:hypothetical protein